MGGGLYALSVVVLAGTVLWLAASLQQLLARRLGGRRLGASTAPPRARADGCAAPTSAAPTRLGDGADGHGGGAPGGLRQRAPRQPPGTAGRQPPAQDPRAARGALLSRLEAANAAAATAAAASAAAPHWRSAFAGGRLEHALDEMAAGRVPCLLLWLDGSDSVALAACRNTLPPLARALLARPRPRPLALRLDAASADGAFVRDALLGAASTPALVLVWGPTPASRAVLCRAQLARAAGALAALAAAEAAAAARGPFSARAAGIRLGVSRRRFAARSALPLGRAVGAARPHASAAQAGAVRAERAALVSEQDAEFAAALSADQAAEAAEAAAAADAASRAAAVAQRLERRRAARAALEAEPEPERGAADALTVVVRARGGRRLVRRWRADATVAAVCAWVEASCDDDDDDDDAPDARFRLVCALSRTVVGASARARSAAEPRAEASAARLRDVLPEAERVRGGRSVLLLTLEPYDDSGSDSAGSE